MKNLLFKSLESRLMHKAARRISRSTRFGPGAIFFALQIIAPLVVNLIAKRIEANNEQTEKGTTEDTIIVDAVEESESDR
jgi:hypothetical protein